MTFSITCNFARAVPLSVLALGLAAASCIPDVVPTVEVVGMAQSSFLMSVTSSTISIYVRNLICSIGYDDKLRFLFGKNGLDDAVARSTNANVSAGATWRVSATKMAGAI